MANTYVGDNNNANHLAPPGFTNNHYRNSPQVSTKVHTNHINSTRLAHAWTIGILTNCTPLLLINKAYTYLKYLLAIWNTITRPTPTKVAHNQPRCDTKYTHTPTPQLAYTTYITLAIFIHHSNTPQYALLSKYTTNYQLYAIIITYNPNPSIYNQQMNDNLDSRCHTTLPRLYNQPLHTHSKTQHIIPTHNTQTTTIPHAYTYINDNIAKVQLITTSNLRKEFPHIPQKALEKLIKCTQMYTQIITIILLTTTLHTQTQTIYNTTQSKAHKHTPQHLTINSPTHTHHHNLPSITYIGNTSHITYLHLSTPKLKPTKYYTWNSSKIILLGGDIQPNPGPLSNITKNLPHEYQQRLKQYSTPIKEIAHLVNSNHTRHLQWSL
jgi:hypothetical protein